ncbi:MAG: hypothetical protein KHZ29_03025, partial [Desulfovibrionaceae bacterium]|nr:hypothetical protein [Desulfovibrionaceae bacterium]
MKATANKPEPSSRVFKQGGNESSRPVVVDCVDSPENCGQAAASSRRYARFLCLFVKPPCGLERFAVEKGNRSGGRGSGRPRRMSLKTTLFRRNDGSAAFE